MGVAEERTITAEGPAEGLARLLATLERDIEGAGAIVVSDSQGLPIASRGRGTSTITTTAMATLALSAADKIATSLGLPAVDDVLIEAGAACVLVRQLGRGQSLAVVFPAASNLGYVRIAVREGGDAIRVLLDELG